MLSLSYGLQWVQTPQFWRFNPEHLVIIEIGVYLEMASKQMLEKWQDCEPGGWW